MINIFFFLLCWNGSFWNLIKLEGPYVDSAAGLGFEFLFLMDKVDDLNVPEALIVLHSLDAQIK